MLFKTRGEDGIDGRRYNLRAQSSDINDPRSLKKLWKAIRMGGNSDKIQVGRVSLPRFDCSRKQFSFRFVSLRTFLTNCANLLIVSPSIFTFVSTLFIGLDVQ